LKTLTDTGTKKGGAYKMHKGWPVRDKNGPVSFTLNDRTYY